MLTDCSSAISVADITSGHKCFPDSYRAWNPSSAANSSPGSAVGSSVKVVVVKPTVDIGYTGTSIISLPNTISPS